MQGRTEFSWMLARFTGGGSHRANIQAAEQAAEKMNHQRGSLPYGLVVEANNGHIQARKEYGEPVDKVPDRVEAEVRLLKAEAESWATQWLYFSTFIRGLGLPSLAQNVDDHETAIGEVSSDVRSLRAALDDNDRRVAALEMRSEPPEVEEEEEDVDVTAIIERALKLALDGSVETGRDFVVMKKGEDEEFVVLPAILVRMSEMREIGYWHYATIKTG